MNLKVYFGTMQQDQIDLDHAYDVMRNAFQRYESIIRHVSVTVNDINGPRGGVDKQCRCVLHLKRMSPVVIQDRDQSYVALLNRVASRATHTLNEKIDRAQTVYRGRPQLSSDSDQVFAEA